MTDRELLEQALEALEMWCKGPHDSATRRGANTRSSVAITALRERLAQPYCDDCGGTDPDCPLGTHWEGCEEVHPECKKTGPVAWMYVNTDGECEQIEYLGNEPLPDDSSITPLYTTPPRREWVGLTEEEVYPLANAHLHHQPESYSVSGIYDLARAIEAKLKEKNA